MAERGTRFRLFPQPPWTPGYEYPETVSLAVPAGSVAAGPADQRVYALDPIGKPYPYGLNTTPYGRGWLYLPPWHGPIHQPAQPDRDGHFDHLRPGRLGFELAHAYGCVRFALDVWDKYRGRPLHWHFDRYQERLEIAILRTFANASAGWGFVELGTTTDKAGDTRPFSLNFDVMAHELGHLIVLAGVGSRPLDQVPPDWFGFQEAAGDLVALLVSAHFATVLDRLFAMTRGNLYALNELNRLAELAPNEQIRIASNPARLRRFANGWLDEHELSEPLTGALFDVLVDIYHEALVAEGLIEPGVEDLLDQLDHEPAAAGIVQSIFDRAFDREPDGFFWAFREARDQLGRYLAVLFDRLDPGQLTYAGVLRDLILIDEGTTGGRFASILRVNARWRDIGSVSIGPRRTLPSTASHAFSARTLTPNHAQLLGPLSFRERRHLARCYAFPLA